jgi:adenine C2-methylase RlmN of 23S rRNA A2503 and tRNA A37
MNFSSIIKLHHLTINERHQNINFRTTYRIFQRNGEKPFRAKQVYDWLWSKNLHSIDEMTNLSKDLREKISKEFTINPISVDLLQKSKDGTIKNGVKLHDGLMVESVLNSYRI